MLCPLRFGNYEFEGGQECIGIECGMHKLCNANDAPPEGTFQVSHDYGSTFSPPVKIQGEQDSSDSRIRKGLGYKDVPPHEPSEATKRFIEELDSELDSSEKLEADALALVDNLRVYGCNYAGDAEVEIIGMLDRQAAITDSECRSEFNVLDEHAQALERENEELRKLCGDNDALAAGNDVSETSVDANDGNADTREELEADVHDLFWGDNLQRYARQKGYLDGSGIEVDESITTTNHEGHVTATTVMHLLDRQAEITRRETIKRQEVFCDTCESVTDEYANELQKRCDELQAKVDEYENKSEICTLLSGGKIYTGSKALTERIAELQAKVDELTEQLESAYAKNRSLKAHIAKMQEGRHGWHVKGAELQKQVEELTAELTAARNAHAQAEHEAATLRDKLGRMLDNAHEITRIGGDC